MGPTTQPTRIGSDPTESAKVPDQQIPVEQSPEIDDTEGHPT
jgi:hypothetical protein